MLKFRFSSSEVRKEEGVRAACIIHKSGRISLSYMVVLIFVLRSGRKKLEVQRVECGQNKSGAEMVFLVAEGICEGCKYRYSAF